jgi:uncharacterized protein
MQARANHGNNSPAALNNLNLPLIMNFFLSALGLMMVFEGIPYFCFPKKVKAFAEKLPEIPDSTLRVIGFFLMIMGLLVVYIGGGKNA